MDLHNLLMCILFNFMILTICSTSAGILGFYLNGVAYPNGSTVLRTDIGVNDNALRCTTDSTTCCRSNIGGEMRGGQFYFPDDVTTVPISTSAVDGYYRDRQSRLIRLHRLDTGVIGTMTGRFRCNIPQAGGPPDANLFINIGEYKTISACIHLCKFVCVNLNQQLTYLSRSLLLVITLLVIATV